MARTRSPRRNKNLNPGNGQVRHSAVENHIDKNPAWQFRIVDMEGPWGWSSLSRSVWIQNIMTKLKILESMAWKDILSASGGRTKGTNSHQVAKGKLCKEAQKRLEEIKQDDVDELFSLRLSGKERVWGILDGRVLRIIWYDPKHEVCPLLKK